MTLATKDLPVGYEFPSRSKLMTQERSTVYSDMQGSTLRGRIGLAGKNIHTDAEFARNQGLPGTVADGMISTAFLSTMLVDFFGEGYVKGGRLQTVYIKPVLVNDVLTLRVVVKEKTTEGSAVRFDMDVWCENQNGVTVTAGTASALVR